MWQSAIESQHQSLERDSKNNENPNSHNELFNASIFFISNFLINSDPNSKYINMYYIEPVVKLKECMYIYIYSILQ